MSLPLGVVRLEEVEVHVPLVPDHLRSHKSEEKRNIMHNSGVLTLGARNSESLASSHGGGDQVGEKRGGGSGKTLPQVKQRTGTIIFAAAAGRLGSPVAGGER